MINLLLSNFSATIDIIALLIILFLALYGLIEGFTKTFFTLFGTVFALLIAILISSPVINFLQDEFGVISSMANNVSGLANKLLGKELMQTKLSQATEGSLISAGISGLFIKIIFSVKNKANVSSDATISDVICPTIAYYIVLIISVVALVILIKILFKIISKMVKAAYKSKSVAKIDRILGLILGFVYSIIIIELIILVVGVLPFGITQELYISIQESSFASIIEKIDLLGFVIDKTVNLNIIDIILNTL